MELETFVTRDHKIVSKLRGLREIQGIGQFNVYFRKEYFSTSELLRWNEDEEGRRVIKCSKHSCKTYIFKAAVERYRSFYCDPCRAKDKQRAAKEQVRAEYIKAFENRVGRFAKVVRASYPRLNARKAKRDAGLYLTFTGYRLANRNDIRVNMDKLAIGFNMKVSRIRSMRSYDRYLFTFTDINPMLKEFFND